MKIIVCVKQVPDSDEVKIDPGTGTLRRSEVPGVLNPADAAAVQSAIELAGELRSCGREVSVTALTMGPPPASAVLRESMACGADDGVLLCDGLFAGADTWATSLTLAAAVRKLGGADLILTGRQSTDGETGHIGPQMAEHLDYCQVSGVETVRLAGPRGSAGSADSKGPADPAGSEGLADSAGRIEVVRRMDGREERLSVQLPAVLSMAENRIPAGGLPIGAICDAYEKNLIVWDAGALGLSGEETGLSGSRTVVMRTFLPEAAEKGERLTGSCMQMAEQLRERLEERHLLQRAGHGTTWQPNRERQG